MLADVMKEREKMKREQLEAERSIYNKPYKRNTIIYFSEFHEIGGIETWIYNLGHDYDFSVVYDKADKKQLERLNEIGVETIKYVGQEIECDTLLFCLFGDYDKIKAKKKYLFIHGQYENQKEVGDIPYYDEIYAVSQTAADYFERTTGIKPKVMYNPIKIEKTEKPLIIGVFSRLSSEKGKDRLIYLLDKLKEKSKPFLMLIFTDLPFDYSDSRVVFINPILNPYEWMKKCDYICQLSDREAGSYTLQEALKIGKPLIVTKLPLLNEFGINESNSKIIDFDMSNLDVNDLWNIPKVNNWQEPISREWEDIMKKKTYREKYNEADVIIENMIKETGAKTIEIKAIKKPAAKKKSGK